MAATLHQLAWLCAAEGLRDEACCRYEQSLALLKETNSEYIEMVQASLSELSKAKVNGHR